ncbi:INO80 complex subunit D [Homalodisca vitripennis]|nr:INO80 complex subunit D [Homalodisca vitripennis]
MNIDWTPVKTRNNRRLSLADRRLFVLSSPYHSSGPTPSTDAVEVVSDEVLAIASMDPTELVTQASRLLEEHDITSMLNQIPADAFTDIFLEDKNGEYEPTREQTEGLERALEEVDKEVRSLERMTRSLPLPCLPIDPINLLDDVGGYVTYPNGFTSVAQASDLRHT